MIIYFLRHGLAGDRETWVGDDRLRPLTKEGKKSMAAEAEMIARLDLKLAAIITSPLTRAFQTAEIVAKRLDMKDRLVEDERLSPGFGLDELAELVGERREAPALMVVGHEPDFSETISALIGGGNIVCKKGGLARVDLLEDSFPAAGASLQGELVWLIPPKVLAG